jgi:FAD/FMN-containing dehydrogenase
MAILITRDDPRYNSLQKGHNARWPEDDASAAKRILLCENASDTAEALQRIVDAGLRPTVRSGGHCYEDFVANNPGGAILDLSLLANVKDGKNGPPYRLGPGVQLWNGYLELYKRYSVTLPGGTCGTVAAGGHISGGGYGLLSRLHGLSCDWLTAAEILTVDGKGKVVSRRVDAHHDTDLFRGCRGAGGGNFGVITSYEFEKLPQSPLEVIEANISFAWADMTLDKFLSILTIYGEYWETRGQEPDTWGMFAVLVVSHQSSGRFGMSVQFCNPDGTCHDLTVLNEYLDRFSHCGSVATPGDGAGHAGLAARKDAGELVCSGVHTLRRRSWLDATAGNGGGGSSNRAKYKSAYMKHGFTEREARCIYKHMTRTMLNVDLRGSVIEIDCYGGAINNNDLLKTTSVAQRASVLKLQFMTFWSNEEDDAARLLWIRDLYKDLYSDQDADPKHRETPYWSTHYEGCYINYPDKDMLAYDYWPQLYYGQNGLYPFLQSVKRKYDPNNIFHHAMSIRPEI